MIAYIYGVALNGTSAVITYPVIKETPKTYVLDYYGKTVRKATMSDRWERYYTNKEEAEEFLSTLLYNIKKATKRIDVNYIYRELIDMWKADDSSDRLKSLIKYVEEFI